jgi:hypothetical protein
MPEKTDVERVAEQLDKFIEASKETMERNWPVQTGFTSKVAFGRIESSWFTRRVFATANGRGHLITAPFGRPPQGRQMLLAHSRAIFCTAKLLPSPRWRQA